MLREWHGKRDLTMVTDAAYVMKGFEKRNRKAYREGVNGDIWDGIFKEMDRMEIKPVIQ